MGKQIKDKYVQIRVSSRDKEMIEALKKRGDFSASSFFREELHRYYAEKLKNGVGVFSVG